jgi:hypothetical protein
MYVKVCLADVPCTDGYLHFMRCTDIIDLYMYTDVSFWFQLLICPASWPVGRDWVLPDVTFKFKHKSALAFSLLPPHLPAFLAGLGADPATAGAAAGSSPPAGEQLLQLLRGEQSLQRLPPGLLWHCQHTWCLPSRSNVLLVLRLGYDYLGLGATAGTLKPLDIQVISGLLATATWRS